MLVKRTLFATCVVSLLLDASFNMIFATLIMLLLLGTSFIVKLCYRTFYLSIIANTQDCTLQIPKMCYCGLCKYALIMPLFMQIFVRVTCARRSVVAEHFIPQSQLSGGRG